MADYNNEEAFVNMINRRKEKEKSAEDEAFFTQLAVSNEATAIYNKMKYAKNKQQWMNEEKIRIEKNKLMKKWLIAGTLVGTLVAGIAVSAIWGDDIAAYKEKHQIISTQLAKEITSARRELLDENLAEMIYTKAYPFTVLDNSVFDYKALDVQDFADVYVYKNILSRDEFDKFIKSVYYTNEEGMHYYTDYSDFLRVNDFASEREFENAARNVLYEEAIGNAKGGK